jgi:putative FmdB family regulatory protein
MPTYEYRCKDCGQHVEVVQSFKDDPLTECPNCRGQLRKVFGNVGIAFKGSGFYKTDSRSSSSSSSSSSSKAGSSESASGGSSSSSSDAKSSDSKSSDAKPSDSKSSDSKSSDSSGGGKSEAKSA